MSDKSPVIHIFLVSKELEIDIFLFYPVSIVWALVRNGKDLIQVYDFIPQ